MVEKPIRDSGQTTTNTQTTRSISDTYDAEEALRAKTNIVSEWTELM